MRNVYRELEYEKSVFINCPFDHQFQPLLKAIVFAIYHCGFIPVSVMSEDNAMETRIDKVCRIIKNCKYGLHDISRTETGKEHLPRFNMPFELGIFYGARQFGIGIQRFKNAIIFEKTRYSYQKYLSDISGIDIKAHENYPTSVIVQIRNWLSCQSTKSIIGGTDTLITDFNSFNCKLPSLITVFGFRSIEDLTFNDLIFILQKWFPKVLHN